MRISTLLSYASGFKEAVKEVQQLESAGLDVVWVPEAYSYDAPSAMGYLAAKTERDAIVKPAGPAEAADYLEKGLANTNDEITKLTALRPPAAQTADWDATLALLKDRNTLIQATVDKIKGGADAQQTITADSAAIDAANTQAKAKAGSFGFAVCGKSG